MTSNSIIVDVFEDSAMTLVTMISNQLSSSDDNNKDEFVSLCEKANESGDREGLITLIINKIDNILEFESDSDCDGAFQIIMTLTYGLDDVVLNNITSKIIEKLCNYDSKIHLRLKLYITMFNLAVKVEVKALLLKAILDYAIKMSLSKYVNDFHDKIEGWLNEWSKENGISEVLKDDIYKLSILNLESINGYNKMLQILLKYLATKNNKVDDEMCNIILKVVINAIKTPLVEFNYRNNLYEGLGKYKSIVAISDGSNSNTKLDKLYNLLRIICTGTIQEYNDYVAIKENVTIMNEDDVKIDVNSLRESVQLLSLCSLCAERTLLTYDDVATELNVDVFQVEKWTVKAISQGLIHGTIDQSKQQITVTKAGFRRFGSDQWKLLKAKFSNWEKNIEQILEEFTDH